MDDKNPEFQIHSSLSETKKAALVAVVSQLLESKSDPVSRPAAGSHSAWVNTFQIRKKPR